jgi:hypothetical protein
MTSDLESLRAIAGILPEFRLGIKSEDEAAKKPIITKKPNINFDLTCCLRLEHRFTVCDTAIINKKMLAEWRK